jgi:hypothetical protein
MAVKTTQIDGDMSLGRNIAMGGKATIAGSTQIGHDLVVKGWLDAPNIKAANKGVFTSLEALEAAYPEPQDGWFAGIGDSTPFTAYTGQDGSWVATGGTIDITTDMTRYTEDIEQLQQDSQDLSAQIGETAEDLEGYKEEVAGKYGDYSDISEFLEVKTDSEDRILEGTRNDGTKVFMGDVDAPNIRQLDTDVTQAKSQAQSAAEQTQQLSQDVVEKYGDYDEIDEYLDIVTDAEGHMLEATRKDGTKVFFGNIESPEIIRQNQAIQQQAEDLARVQETTDYFEQMVSEEWSDLSLDENNRIIKGTKKDGTTYISKLESPTINGQIKNIVTDLIGNIGKDINLQPSAFLPVEVQHRTSELEIPNLDNSTLTPVVVDTQEDWNKLWGWSAGGTVLVADTDVLIILNTDIKVTQNPELPANRVVVINGNGHKLLGWSNEYQATSVKGTYCSCAYPYNQSSYNAFQAGYSYSVNNLVKVVYNGTTYFLKCRVAHTSENDFATELNEHKDKWYYQGIYGSNVFIAPDGEVLRLARSRCYTTPSDIVASDDIEDANGNVVFHEGDAFPRTSQAFSTYTWRGVTYNMNDNCVYHCKLELPAELEDLTIPELNAVYVNITTDWDSVQAKVKKVEDGWLYFDYVRREENYDGLNNTLFNALGINNDVHVSNRYASFYLINHKIEDNNSCLLQPVIENSIITGYTLLWPNRYTTIAESVLPLFRYLNDGSVLKVFNATLVALNITRTKYTSLPENETGDVFILDKCLVKGCVGHAIYIGPHGAEGYITNCEITDCDFHVIYGFRKSKIYAVGNYIHDVGNRRLMSYGIAAFGIFYIAHNRVVDFGYSAIHAGLDKCIQPIKEDGVWVTEGTYFDCHGIIEYNTVHQTPEYFQNKAVHFVTMDAGAIYCGLHTTELIVRHNIVWNYTGRGFNRGMYFDAGCYNYYVYSNIIANTTHLSIKAYFAEDNTYLGLPYTLDNVNKNILNNYVENGIELGGRTNYPVDGGRFYSDQTHQTGWDGQALADNGCYLGHNVINTQMQTVDNSISGIKDANKEEQYFINIPAYQGAFSTTIGIKEWLNKL